MILRQKKVVKQKILNWENTLKQLNSKILYNIINKDKQLLIQQYTLLT